MDNDNQDQNFRSRRQLPEYHPPPPTFESRSPPRPAKIPQEPIPSLTVENLAAATSNGYLRDGLTSPGDSDPATFYRGVQSPANGFTHQESFSMAATMSDPRPVQSSLRSNGNGTTPKHPPLPQVRAGLRPSIRSASSPLDNRAALNNAKSTSALNGYGNSRQPSVKDLLKRFDQNNEQSSSTPPKPAPRVTTREGTRPSYVKDRVGNATRSASNLNTSSRSGTTLSAAAKQRSPPNPPRTTQRARFAAEDQHSNNTLSSAARTTRSRNSIAGNNTQASKSMTNLSPTSSSSQARRPLFGEIVPLDQDTLDIGYGIPARVATRRTSESSIRPSFAHQRRRSDVDISPSSPTAWYLGVTPALDDVDPNKRSRLAGHNRSHSDLLDAKVNTMNGVSPSFQTSNSPTSSAARRSSKLPVARNTSISSSESSTTASTRANSPFHTKTISNGKMRKSDQRPWSPAGRATTPTSRAKTPTHTSPRGKHRTPDKSTSNNASLKAYISAPLPKTSPPLRSSRPRAPISTATTKAIGDRSNLSQQTRTGMKLTRNNAETKDTRERKIPDVPLSSVDFHARREKIQRAYTRSIHENEQKEIRAANLRRLTTRQNAEKLAAQIEEKKEEVTVPAEPLPVLELPPPTKVAPQPLQIDTSFQKPNHVVVRGYDPAAGEDSPTLGIPGAFIDDDEPPSAISNVTGTTDIENEPQMEPARLSEIPSLPSGISSTVAYLDESLSPEQAMFGLKNIDQESIQIMLDATPVETSQQDSTPTKGGFGRDDLPDTQSSENYFMEERPVFTSTLTTASPPPNTVSHAMISPPEIPEIEEQDQNQLHSQVAPEIYFTDEIEYTSTPESGEAPRLQLPLLRTALAPPSQTGNDSSDLQTPLTDIEYESSEVGGINNDEHDPYGPEYAVREGLISPTTLRFSTRSSWRTDYSVGTGDEYSERENGQPDSEYESTATQPMYPDREKAPTPPPKELIVSPAVPPKPEGYSPLPSPRFANDIPRIPSPQLPPVATGEGFSFSFSDDSPGYGTVTIPQWPPYSPPPPPAESSSENVSTRRSPPPPSFYNRRPPSSYHSSQNGAGRNADSRRASDEVYSPRGSISTPRSSTHISLEDPDVSKQKATTDAPLTEEEKKAAEKQRKRLFQRSMVIKELIDTESVYLKDMNVVEEIYKGTAEACPKLEAGDIKVIFRNTDKIVEFSTKFLDELKTAASPVYTPRHRSKANKPGPTAEDRFSVAPTLTDETEESKDKKTSIGSCFSAHLKEMEDIYTDFLKNSEAASSRLVALQHDSAVKVWLSECNLVAKDLTAAWDLDALLVKPVQRITRYQLLLTQICSSTPEDHPDHVSLQLASAELLKLLTNIDDLKKRIHMVGKIVGRKRKESDVRVGSNFVKALRRNDKLGTNPDRSKDDADYLNSHEKFSDDFLRLQVVLRDVQFYTRTAATWVQDFLRYLSSMELIMRMAASQFPEIESKWARYNMSMRDMGTHILESHVDNIEKRVIAPIEQVIAAYGPPALAMKKRDKRRIDFEKATTMKQQGKKIEAALADRVAQYEALNETLKMELPKLSNQTKAIGNICLAQLVCIQADWWGVWQTKVKAVLEENQIPKDIADLVDMFFRDFRYSEARVTELGIVNGIFGNEKFGPLRGSQSTSRSRGLSVNSEKSPTIPNTDFQKRLSANLNFSPIFPTTPGTANSAYNPAAGSTGHSRVNSNSPATPDHPGPRHRPNTGRSFTSDGGRVINDYNTQYRRESGSTYSSTTHHIDGPPVNARPQSGLFHSAMPMGESWEDSNRSSRASSHDRVPSGGYSVLYLAASLFEFNISATKQEAGYPYLTYQAGEIFDVIGEKGELWLAKNQDDPDDTVGWIWSKHFARLAAN